MKSIAFSFFKILVICLFFACSNGEVRNFDLEEATQEILALHDQQRIVHVLKQADTFSELLSQNHTSINRGYVSVSTQKQNLERFQNYFSQVEFIKWDDLRPPTIRFSDDGSMAYVMVEKIVLLQFENEHGTTESDTSIFAWMAIHRKNDNQWKIESVASTDRSYTNEMEALKNIHAVANCNSPKGKYLTELRASNTGYFSFYQKFDDRDVPFKCVINGDSAIVLSESDQIIDTLSQVDQLMIQGHNFHMMAYYPDKFFENIYQLPRRNIFRNIDVRTWQGSDPIGNKVAMHTCIDNGYVIGIEMINPLDTSETIEIFYSDYNWLKNVPLAQKIEIVQAQRDTFTFDFESLELNVDNFSQISLSSNKTD
jgi:hypothetical protein